MGARTDSARMAHGLGGLFPEDYLEAQAADQKEFQVQWVARLAVAARGAGCVRMMEQRQIHLSLLCTHLFVDLA